MKNKYKHNFLDTWKKSKDVFIKPKFKWFIGLWKKEGNLPVWRRGPQIRWGRYGEIKEEWNWARLESAEWNEFGKKNHPILSKIIKKPVWQLPIWLAFHWYNDDIMYKTKWSEDDFRYECPAHITIVFFGFAISVTAYIPREGEDDWLCQDQYWEAMLTYQYYNGDLKKTNDACGWYNRPGQEGFRFKFEPRFLKNIVDRDELISLQEKLIPEIIAKYEEEDKERIENQLFAIQMTSSSVEENKFDGWYCAVYNGNKLLYKNEEDRNKAYENLKTNVKRKVKGVLKNIEYKKTYADKRYVGDWKTMDVNKSDLIDKNIDILENIYEKE